MARDNTKHRVISFRVDPETEEAVTEFLQRNNIKMSTFMERAVEAYLANTVASPGAVQGASA